MSKQSPFVGVAVAALCMFASSARADEPAVGTTDLGSDPVFDSLELSVDLGLLDRGTTGVGEPLLGLGYDHGGGFLAGGSVRTYVEINRYFRHGVSLRLSHQGGSMLGLNDRVGFSWSQLDLAYVFRTSLPCMSDDDVQYYLSGLVGLTGVHADAGTGTAPHEDRWNERVVASGELDHDALGALLGVNVDVHWDAFFVGLILDVREVWALGDGPVSRSFVTTGALRTGVELEL